MRMRTHMTVVIPNKRCKPLQPARFTVKSYEITKEQKKKHKFQIQFDFYSFWHLALSETKKALNVLRLCISIYERSLGIVIHSISEKYVQLNQLAKENQLSGFK